MTTPEQDYALEECARGMAMEMYLLLDIMLRSVHWQTLEQWHPRIRAMLDKVEGKE